MKLDVSLEQSKSRLKIEAEKARDRAIRAALDALAAQQRNRSNSATCTDTAPATDMPSNEPQRR